MRYGTVMVDIETGRIVDMIYSRESAEVVAWLKTYPNISVVSRDGSLTYAHAISAAHPSAIQVSDRFHLVKGLTDAARKYVIGLISPRFRIESTGEKESGGYWGKPLLRETDLPQRLHNATTEKRALVAERVRELAAQGLNVHRISKETGLSWSAVKRYADEHFTSVCKAYGVNFPSKLKPYTSVIDEMLIQGKKFREIEAAIRALGYAGAASTIRMYATRKRRHNQAAHGESIANTEIVERKWLLKLLYHPIEKVNGITEEQFVKVLRVYPQLSDIYTIVGAFKTVVFAKQADELTAWVNLAKSFGIPEIDSFVGGISRDIDAVKNAIQYDYNNGLAEGHINKIKLIKRIMFGRCSFETLRTKTLAREYRNFN
jgi:transposase